MTSAPCADEAHVVGSFCGCCGGDPGCDRWHSHQGLAGGTGNWNNGPSWNPSGQPNDTDVVTIAQNNAAVTYINTLFPNAVLTSLNVNATNTATLFQSQNVLSAVGETFGFTLAGAMNQSGGTNNVTGNALAIGQAVGGNGSYTLSGTGVLKASVSENIGEQDTGVFTQTGGSNTISGALLFLTIGGDHNASGTYNLSGGTLHAPSITLSNDGAAAAFNHSGGKNTIDDVLEMGDTLNPTGPVQYTLSSAAVLSASREFIGGVGPATFTQTGGSNTAITDFRLGNNLGATGTYNLSGGTLAAQGTFYVGASGTGTFNATGGTLTLDHTLAIGALPGSNGAFGMSNGASVHVTGIQLANNSVATLTINGGTLTNSAAMNVATSNGTATVNLTGGTLASVDLNLKPGLTGKGTFNQSGGTHTLSGAFGVSARGVYNLSGGNFTASESDLYSGGLLKITGGHFKTTSLNFIDNPTGTIDLTNQSFVVDYSQSTPLLLLTPAIVSGYKNGAWNGAGIQSSTAAGDNSKSTAVGFGEASKVLEISGTNKAQFLGQTVDSTSVLFHYTKYGDANLDGTVGFADLVKVAQNYGTQAIGTWADGDFTYDNNIDFADLVKLAQNYGSAVPAEPIPGASADFERDLAAAFATIPEPGAISALLTACGIAACKRRRLG